MADFKQKPILFYVILIAISTLAEDADEAKRLAEIKILEKEKSELYKQINDAIDDSVKHLSETNDTDARVGIELITDLKKQLKLLNGTNDTELLTVEFESLNNTRRKGGGRSRKHGKDGEKDKHHKFHDHIPARKKKGVDSIFDDDLKEKAEFNKKYKERLEHRIKMQYRIEDWLKKKAEEKLKIKKYIYNKTIRTAKTEKCPRFGLDNKKKQKKFKGWFPCCRKCCKKSYMGCLKKK